MGAVVLLSSNPRPNLMTQLAALRAQLVNVTIETLEVLSGLQVVGFIGLEDDNSLTPLLFPADEQLRETLADELGSHVWNGPKSL